MNTQTKIAILYYLDTEFMPDQAITRDMYVEARDHVLERPTARMPPADHGWDYTQDDRLACF